MKKLQGRAIASITAILSIERVAQNGKKKDNRVVDIYNMSIAAAFHSLVRSSTKIDCTPPVPSYKGNYNGKEDIELR